ncbi:MAG: hypothetical protein NC293_01410 [Roseburia sp.]|nr:hypothetical protein [Roseburia sp.]
MKKLLFVLLFLLTLRFLYPFTRFGFQEKPNLISQKHLNIQSATLKPGETIHLKLTGIKRTAFYSSSDFRIASVSSSGTVHARNPGTAIIYVKQDSKTYRCRIRVVSARQ